jgi:hypothetical protein
MDKLSGLSLGLPPMISSPILAATAIPTIPEAPASEAIVSVFTADSSLEGLIAAGATPVLADVDPDTGGMSRACVEAQIGVDTSKVVLEPDHGCYANWEGVQKALANRDITLQIEGKGNVGEWVAIAPGLRGWGKHLVEVDELQILGGPSGVLVELRSRGVEAKAYDTTMAFERPAARVRGRRRDFPGAVVWQSKMIVVEDWNDCRAALEMTGRSLARQMAFDFEAPSKPVLRENGQAKRKKKLA